MCFSERLSGISAKALHDEDKQRCVPKRNSSNRFPYFNLDVYSKFSDQETNADGQPRVLAILGDDTPEVYLVTGMEIPKLKPYDEEGVDR